MINQRNEPVTFDHMKLFLTALGKFHAISLAIQDQQPERFNQLAKLMSEQYWTFFEKGTGISLEPKINQMRMCLKESGRSDLLEKFNKALGDDWFVTVSKLVSSASAEPYAVICHGDLTSNNTMFRKDSQGKPVEIQLFDWQLTRYASPVTDLVIYMFCSTTKEFRDKHYEDLLKIYHQNLSDLLTR